MANYKFNLERSPIDSRDFMLEAVYPVQVDLPLEWDLRKGMQPIRDQGQQGSCSAQSAAAMKEWQEKVDVQYNAYMSPQFVYNNRTNQESEGMTPRDTMRILNKIGIVPEKMFPYGTMTKPSDTIMSAATEYQIMGYSQINTLDSLKKALYANGPCYIAFPVYNAEKMEFWKPDTVGQQMIGGHACFTKDTKVSLLDGRELSFEDLEKEFKDNEFWVYSSNESGNVVPGKAHSPRITQTNAKIIKITLDNGEEIKCTENHQFLLKNGEYKEAKDLTNEDSLMPLYRRITTSRLKGYEQYLNNSNNKWEYTHIMSASYKYVEEKTNKNVIHHKNFKKRDNTPDNLLLMDKEEHFRLHAGLSYGLNNWVKTPEGRKFLSENAKKMWTENKEFREKVSEILRNQGSITIQKLKLQGRKNPLVEWADKNPEDSFKMHSTNGKNNVKFANTKEAKQKASETYKNHMKTDSIFHDEVVAKSVKNFQNYNDKLKSGELKTPEYYNKKKLTALEVAFKYHKYKKYDTFDEYIQKEKGLTLTDDGVLVPYNHKITKIEFYGYEDVYDLTVEKYHNFALSAGVFVHNCCVAGYLKDCFIIRNSWSASWGDGGYTYYKFSDWGMHWECWTSIDAESTHDGLVKKLQMNSTCTEKRKGFFAKLFCKKIKK